MRRPLQAIGRQLEALVHPAAEADPAALPRHAWFIGTRLAIGAAGLAFIPLTLAVRGAIDPVAAGLVVGLVGQALAALWCIRKGALKAAHSASLFGAAAVVAGAAITGDGLLTPALAAVPLLVMEAAIVASASAVRLAVAVSVAALIATAAATGATAGEAIAVLGIHLSFLAFATALALLSMRELRVQGLRERRLAAQNRLLVEGFGDLMTRHDLHGAVIQVGPAAQALLGAAPSALAGRGLFERVHVGDRPQFLMTLADAATTRGMLCATVRIRHGEPEPGRAPVFVWIEMRVRRIEIDDGQGELVCLLRDCTAQKRHHIEATDARRQAEAANAMKDRFLATVSHELRTPLNAIIGFSEMLKDERLIPAGDPRRADYARIIHVSGEHLLGVVNTLLDMSRIDAGTFPIHPEGFDVARLVSASIELVRLKADETGVAIVVDVPQDLPPLIADRQACKQILINLLSNAVKFTPSGGRVDVTVRREGELMSIVVVDTGIGIAPEDLARVGEPFFQARGSYDRPYEGTGLGLSVVRGLVDLHAGTLAIDSTPGCGTRVTVRLGLDTRVRLLPVAGRIPSSAPRLGAASAPAEPVKKSA